MLLNIDTTNITLSKDTLNSVENQLALVSDKIPPQIIYAFAISCIILFLTTVFKHGLGVSLRKMKKMPMLLELSVDICATIVTIIASMQTSKSYSLVLLMAICSIIPIVLGSLARQYWLDYSTKGICWQSVVSAIVNIVMPIIWLVIICEIFFF